jgi:ATP-dependent Lon protease
MDRDIQSAFRNAAEGSLEAFIGLIENASRQPEIQEAYKNAPAKITRGRSFPEMVLDDLIDAYETIIGDDGDPDVNAVFYKRLVEKRDGRAYTPEKLQARLEKGLARKKNLRTQDIGDKPPEFLAFFQKAIPAGYIPSDPPDIFEAVAEAWPPLINLFSKLNQSGKALAIGGRADLLDQKTNTLLDNIFGGPGEGMEDLNEIDDLENRLGKLNLSEEARTKTSTELRRLERMDPRSPEYSSTVDYLETVAALPWGKMSTPNKDLRKAAEILDKDHFGMEDVKKRILETIAVQNRTGKPGGKVLALIGPPGIGKTTFGKSLARAMDRPFYKISLSGVNDPTELRGHRRTYLNSAPGKLIEASKHVRVDDPVILLDETDKMTASQGYPAHVLLELFDPGQNKEFRDHYLNLGYDFSKALFVCTANEAGNIPGPLYDRMEVIDLPGYSREEKLKIAMRHLIPRQMEERKLEKRHIAFHAAALRKLIDGYTLEAGVRDLEKTIGKICDKAVVQFAMGRRKPVTVTAENLADYAGEPEITPMRILDRNEIGAVIGLAYTDKGGVILPIQAVATPSESFRLEVTGNVGKAIVESVTDTVTMIRKHANQFGISPSKLDKTTLHVHLPDGTSKDGPSAGLAIATAIVSELTQTPVNRKVAMTGAIDIKGNAWEIGGLRQKLEGAQRAGSKIVIIPKTNEKDLSKIPEIIKKGLTILPVSRIEDVLDIALMRKLTPIFQPAAAQAERPAESPRPALTTTRTRAVTSSLVP